MKTTKDEIELLRHHAHVVANRDQGALILSVLDDLDEAEARAERWKQLAVDGAELVDMLNGNLQGMTRGEIVDAVSYAVAENYRLRINAALAETSNKTSETGNKQGHGSGLATSTVHCADQALPTSTPAGGSEGAGTSSPDDAPRAPTQAAQARPRARKAKR